MVLYEVVDPHVARITLNRPHRRNAILTPVMNRELKAKIRQAEDDDEVKVIVLAGAGEDFCAGEDIARVPVETFGMRRDPPAGETSGTGSPPAGTPQTGTPQAGTPDAGTRRKRLPQSPRIHGIQELQENSWALLKCDKVVIASVQGGALGLGFNLALCCDLIVASDDATFARRQTRIGFAAFDMLLPVVLLKLGINRGYEIILTGRKVTAADLAAWGVVSSVVPVDGLADEALRYARAVALHSTDGLMIGRQAKKLFWDMMGISQWNDFVNIGHPLFTNLVWREDETNLLKERERTGNAREALDAVHRRWEELGFD
jgi:enoyl-CoA hydratase/carnithine racemase